MARVPQSGWFASQSDWVEKTKGNLIVSATVIAGISFEVMINPPGGVSQIGDSQPKITRNRLEHGPCDEWGTSVLGCGDKVPPFYTWMVISSNVAFAASMGVILLAVSGLKLRNKFMIMIMQLLMMTAIICISASFFLAVILVHPRAINLPILFAQLAYLAFWALFAVAMLVIQVVSMIRPPPRRSTSPSA